MSAAVEVVVVMVEEEEESGYEDLVGWGMDWRVRCRESASLFCSCRIGAGRLIVKLYGSVAVDSYRKSNVIGSGRLEGLTIDSRRLSAC